MGVGACRGGAGGGDGLVEAETGLPRRSSRTASEGGSSCGHHACIARKDSFPCSPTSQFLTCQYTFGRTQSCVPTWTAL